MGFDLARFIGEVDEEFQCPICRMVLENPVQGPCHHLFCLECINDWLSINPSCPVDRQPLAISDLEPIHRSLRNLLSKLEIKCDFDSQGCNAAIKLEGLQGHLANCDYNQSNVLQQGKEYDWGIVRSFHALEPKNSNFKVQVLNGQSFFVGLSLKEETNDTFGEWYAYYYGYHGSLTINKVEEYKGSKCKIGDIIELGIKFPLNFASDGNASVELYLSINERVVTEKLMKLPIDAIYPTIEIFGGIDIKIKYFGI